MQFHEKIALAPKVGLGYPNYKEKKSSCNLLLGCWYSNGTWKGLAIYLVVGNWRIEIV